VSYNPLHDCPASPCVIPGKIGATAFVGATLNDTVALTVLAVLVKQASDPAEEIHSERRAEVAVRAAFALADEFCAQRYARAKLSQAKAEPGAAG
jgi:uncharacterized membrane protein (DUF4010 family)